MRVVQTSDEAELTALAKQLARSKRTALVVGAGISTGAGIPDFRSAATGLFARLKEQNPDLKISSGKELFHCNLFQREDTTRAFYQMCAEMKRMAIEAPPTDFHLLMKDFDDAGKLFRIYTQNIDSLEAKAGLSFGLGEWQERERLVSKPKPRPTKKGLSQKAKGKQRAVEAESEQANILGSGAAGTEGAEQDNVLPPFAQFSEGESMPQMGFFDETSSKASTLEQSSSMKVEEHPASNETIMVPDSQEEAANADKSNFTESSSLTDLSITDLFQMPFGSQDSSATEEDLVRDDAGKSEAPVRAPVSQPVEKQITIQRFLTVPRVIPLHGTLDEMHCTKCQHVEQLDKHLNTLASGHSIHCPQCVMQDSSRSALGERSRGVGVLKVSVVLYGEEHKQASRVGEIAEKDLLKAARPDVLIVAGTTLRIPGVKKIVKELAKVVKQQIEEEVLDEQGNPTGEWIKKDDPTRRVIFVNNDAPNPEKSWSDVFDTFVQGDAQVFAQAVRRELEVLKNPPPPAVAVEKKKVAAAIPQKQLGLASMFGAVKKSTTMADFGGKVTLAQALPLAQGYSPDSPSFKDMADPPKIMFRDLADSRAPSESAASTSSATSLHQTQQANRPSVSGKGTKKLASGKKMAKQQDLGSTAPPPQSVKAEPKKPKRPPKKSVAQVQREALKQTKLQLGVAEAKAAAPPLKPKCKPGWRGYAIATEEVKPKYEDFWATAVDGPRRRGLSSVPRDAGRSHTPSGSAQPVASGSGSGFFAALADSISPSTSSIGVQIASALPTDLSPIRAAAWPSSSHPSTASTPPSMYSDLGTVSDNEEVRSIHGAGELANPSSQETDHVSASVAGEDAADLTSFPSSNIAKHSTTLFVEDSQPVTHRSLSPISSQSLTDRKPSLKRSPLARDEAALPSTCSFLPMEEQLAKRPKMEVA